MSGRTHVRARRQTSHSRLLFWWTVGLFCFVLPITYLLRAVLLAEELTLLRDLVAAPLIGYLLLKHGRQKLRAEVWVTLTGGLIVLLTTGALSVLDHKVPIGDVLRTLRIVASSILFILLPKVLREKDDVTALCNGIITVGIVSVVYGVKQDFLGFALFERSYLLSAVGVSRSPEHFFRVFSFWGTPSVYAGVVTCALWCLVSLGGRGGSLRRRLMRGVVGVLLAYGIWISRMRIFYVANGVGLLVYLALIWRGGQRLLLLLLVPSIIGVSLTTGLLSDTAGAIEPQPFHDTIASNVDFRVDLWRNWLHAVDLRLFGLGVDAVGRLPIATPDNTYFFMLIWTGWLGLLIYVYLTARLAILPVLSRFAHATTPPNKSFWGAVAAFLTAALVAGMTSSVMVNSVFAPYFWFFAGLSRIPFDVFHSWAGCRGLARTMKPDL